MNAEKEIRRILHDLNSHIKTLYKFEAQGVFPKGTTRDFCITAQRLGVNVEPPSPPKIHWWDRYIVHPTRIRALLEKDGYFKALIEYLGAVAQCLRIYDRIKRAA